ncbi:MAG: CvpA family protein [Gammaproteobacteria bacterium]|nr:CvpA family protein [Gammaproteobacteria bacterium]
MIWIDYVILAVILVSALISLARGFVKESLSLATWVIAFWVALTLAPHLASLLASLIDAPSLRLIVAFAVLFLVTLVLGATVNQLMSGLVKRTGLSGTDRAVGVFFGLARGVVIVALLVLVGSFTALPQDPWWEDSRLIPYFHHMALWLQGFLPQDVAGAA